MAAVIPLDDEKAKAVLRQVEFYFSDSNLPRDRFLKSSVQESKDGLVSLALICSFSRMRNYLGLGDVTVEEVSEETVSAVSEVLKKSSLLKVSKDGKRIGRRSKLLKMEEVMEQVDSRTIAAGPLPYDVKIEDLESFFSKHGKVNSVRLPRHVGDKRAFCGTALVEFSDENGAKKVLNESFEYAGTVLELNPKKVFDAERKKEWEEFGQTPSNMKDSNGSYPRGLILSFKLKSMSTKGSIEQNDPEASNLEVPDCAELVSKGELEATENVIENEKSSENVEKEGKDKADENTKQKIEQKAKLNACLSKGSSVMSEDNNVLANDKSVITREDLKFVFQKYGTVKYIDYTVEGVSGYICYEQSDAAIKARAIAVLADKGGLVVKKSVAVIEAVTGDAEREYWSSLHSNHEKVTENSSTRGRGRNNKGGRQFNGKRGRQMDSPTADGRSNKFRKT